MNVKMTQMKRAVNFVVMGVLLGIISQGEAMAKVFTVSKTGTFTKRAEEIKEIIVDIENICDNGCKYKLSNVREIRPIEMQDENHFYTWYYIDAARDSYYYQENTITRPSASEIVITSNFPTREKIKELKEKYTFGHKSLFDKIESRFDLKENFDGNGNFVNTSVSFSNKVVSDSTIIRIFSGTVKSELNKTADELFKNFGQN